MKKLLVLICFVMIMSLCACGSKAQPAPTAAPTAAPTEAPAEEVPAEVPAEEVPAEVPAEEVPAEAPAEEVPAEVPAEEDTEPEENDSSDSETEMFNSYAYIQLDTEGKPIWQAQLAGIMDFPVPDAFISAKGGVRATGGLEVVPGSGIVYMTVVYLPYTKSEYNDFLDRIAEFTENHPKPTKEDREAYMEMVREYNDNAYRLFDIFGIDKNGSAEDLLTRLKDAYLKDGNSEEDVDKYLNSIVEIIEAGSAEDFNFYIVKSSRLSEKFTGSQADYAEEYDALYDEVGSFAADFTFMRPVGLTELISEGTGLTFETKDLNDNPVSSSELFGSHKATMVNIWETTCSSCISEMPDLKKMADEFEAKGGQIVGLVYDAIEDDLIDEAKDINKDLGLNFVNLLPTREILDFFNVQAFPTTYFFNEKGEVTGAPIIGINPESYVSRMNELLENK